MGFSNQRCPLSLLPLLTIATDRQGKAGALLSSWMSPNTQLHQWELGVALCRECRGVLGRCETLRLLWGSVSLWLHVAGETSAAYEPRVGSASRCGWWAAQGPCGSSICTVGFAHVWSNNWSAVRMKRASLRGRGLIRFSGKRLNLRSYPSYCYAFEFSPRRWVKGFIFVLECFECKWCLYFEYREVELHFIPAIMLCDLSEKLWCFSLSLCQVFWLINPLSCYCASKYHVVWGSVEMLWSPTCSASGCIQGNKTYNSWKSRKRSILWPVSE